MREQKIEDKGPVLGPEESFTRQKYSITSVNLTTKAKLFTLTMFLIILKLFIILSQMAHSKPRKFPLWDPSSTCPLSIVATIPGGGINKTPTGDFNFPDISTIHKALTTCPGIESLSLRFATLGCTGHPDRWSLPFNLEGGERYPPLKHLNLEGYSFEDQDFERGDIRHRGGVGPPRGWPIWDSYLYEWIAWIRSGRARRWWELRKLPEEQSSKTNAELWADAMDWSSLEELELESGTEFEKHISPLLTGLKELTIHARDGNHTLEWLLTLQPLRKLAWSGGIDASPAGWMRLLEHHGSTLQTLDVHNQDQRGAGPFLAHQQVQQIGELAPDVKRLAIAIERNGSWPMGNLEAIARLPRLEEVEVWMQYASKLGYSMNGERPEYRYTNETYFKYQKDSPLFEKPILDRSAAQKLWKFMREKSAGKLVKVSFCAGDWTRSWDGPLYLSNWLEQKRVGYVCTEDGCKFTDRKPDVWEKEDEEYWRRSMDSEEFEHFDDRLTEDDFDEDIHEAEL